VLVAAALLGVEGWFPGLVPAPGALLVAAVLLGLTVLGVWVGNRAALDWNGVHDPGGFVLDEVVGQLIPLMALLPGPISPLGLALAFGLFRLFDISKPPPCRRLEALPGGVGIMADDVAAGLYALLILAVVPV
jgi:phosphatidylglycerophosphatase A